MRYEFHPEALEEYRQATIWYAEREQKLALQFVAVNHVFLCNNCCTTSAKSFDIT
jgi:hypothetical protein